MIVFAKEDQDPRLDRQRRTPVSAMEWLHDLRQLLGANADARIGHGDLQEIADATA
jgi:hypothetical protein